MRPDAGERMRGRLRTAETLSRVGHCESEAGKADGNRHGEAHRGNRFAERRHNETEPTRVIVRLQGHQGRCRQRLLRRDLP